MALAAGHKLSHYEIVELVGKGGMGEVYRAHDTQLGREAAIKILPADVVRDTDHMARFQREARVLAAMNHANIATVYELVDDHAIAMELIDGPTLADRIKKGVLPLQESIAIARQIVDALEAAHEKGIMHRDLKPGNIKIRPDGTVKVLDFGLAKHYAANPAGVDSAALTMGQTEPGVIVGTAAYMAPEQAAARPADWRADIWSFGAVWFEMATGKRPFAGETMPEVLAAVMGAEPALDAVPRRIRPLIAGVCARIHASAGSLSAMCGSRWKRISQAARQTRINRGLPRLPWAVAATLLVGLVALAGIFSRGSVPAPPQTIRFVVPTPGGEAQEVLFAASPDGKSLAITAPQDGKRYLWLHSLVSGETRLIRGSQGAEFPFWSPNGDQIGFVADGKLKNVALDGRTPVALANGQGFGTWNINVVILFSCGGGGLCRVSEQGGNTNLVLRTGHQVSNPHFLPGGNRFLFTQDEPAGVYVGALDGSTPVRILEDFSKAEFVPATVSSDRGYLLFRRRGQLMVQPFDPESLVFLSDSAVPVTAEQVINNPGYGSTVLFSAAGLSMLAFQTDVPEQLTWVNRTGAIVETVGPPGEYSNFRLSRDGNWVAMDISRHEGGRSAREIARMDLRRGTLERLTFHPDADPVPVWSPSGGRIAFVSNRLGGFFDPWVTSGPDQETLLADVTPTGGHPLGWSRDGRFLLYSGNDGDLWIVPVDGVQKPYPYFTSKSRETEAAFSSDGRWIAYESDESGRNEVYVQPFPIGGRRYPISGAGGFAPAWSNDGRWLFFVSPQTATSPQCL